VKEVAAMRDLFVDALADVINEQEGVNKTWLHDAARALLIEKDKMEPEMQPRSGYVEIRHPGGRVERNPLPPREASAPDTDGLEFWIREAARRTKTERWTEAARDKALEMLRAERAANEINYARLGLQTSRELKEARRERDEARERIERADELLDLNLSYEDMYSRAWDAKRILRGKP
jgi:hypothetical protein